MLNTSTQVQLIQCQLKILETLILADGLVEYDANWLKNAGSVMRDGSGRFARKAQSVKEDVTALAVGSGELLKISASEISAMVKDPAFRERAGLSSSMLIGQSIGNLVAKAKIFPGLSAEIDKMIAQQEKKLADIYGDDNTALAQAFRKSKLPKPPKDASMKEKMEFYVARYQAYDDAMKSPEFYRTPIIPVETAMDTIAKVAKASVPVAVGIGLNLAVDLAIPLLLGNPLSLGVLAATSVVSYGVSEAASWGTQKALDKTGLNKTQKTIADIAVRILAGAAVSGVASKVVGNMAEKKAAEVATKKAAEEGAKRVETAKKLEKEVEDELAKKSTRETARRVAERDAASKAEAWVQDNKVIEAIEEWSRKNKDSFRMRINQTAHEALTTKLPEITDPVDVKAIGSMGTDFVSVVLDRAELEALTFSRGAINSLKNGLLRTGSYGSSNTLLMSGLPEKFTTKLSQKILSGQNIEDFNLSEMLDEMGEMFFDEATEAVRLECVALARLPKIKGSPGFARYIESKGTPFENIKPGDSFCEPGIMSCSRELEDLSDYSHMDTKFMIKPKSISNARDFDTPAYGAGFKEVRYPPGSKFTVESVEVVNRQKVITILED
jgi:hypothetical protein